MAALDGAGTGEQHDGTYYWISWGEYGLQDFEDKSNSTCVRESWNGFEDEGVLATGRPACQWEFHTCLFHLVPVVRSLRYTLVLGELEKAWVWADLSIAFPQNSRHKCSWWMGQQNFQIIAGKGWAPWLLHFSEPVSVLTNVIIFETLV